MGHQVSISTLHGTIGGWRADPATPAKGAVIVVQEIFGLNSHIRATVEKFAEHGFIAIAPALFDLIEHDIELGYTEADVERGRELRNQLGADRAVDCVRAAMEEVEAEGFVGVVGYCWGGTIAYLTCARLGLPAVSYYGGGTVPYLDEKPSSALMLHFGEKDPLISAEDVAAHREALAEAKIHTWPAGHGFNCDQRADYNAAVAADAMEHTLKFFEVHLE
ncbi:MAG: dienelactone hydrolase family protein [Arenimonas sp.]